MKKLILVLFAAILCFSLCACNGADKDDISAYVGKTYIGTTPWGDDLSVTVKSYDDPTMDVAVEETISPEFVACSEYGGGMVKDNVLILQHAGELEEDGSVVTYEYSKKLEFRDDTIVLTYIDGQATEKNPEGDSGFHQVGALSEDEKTVVLTRK